MTPERWQRIQELFHAAESLDVAERAAFLARESPGEHSVRREVMALLDCDADPQLERVVAQAAVDWNSGPSAPEGYKVLGRIGEGGMGEVYEAEQLNPRRRVALKFIRNARHDPRTRQMFQREAEALGRLSHAGIATIYESGVTAGDTPFIAMELVAGQPLQEWLLQQPALGAVRKNELGPRLAVFRAICDAIVYAHQNGVIHRDLKPSNIMVLDNQAVKVLDFGLARILEYTEGGDQTESGIVQGSVPYMSPEQAAGESNRIDTRTDVHALGVILYELLTGRHPYLEGTESFVESLRRIRDTAPLRFAADSDLEAIVFKALEKEPEHRYQSVSALAEDLDRYLADLPIAARPPDTFYQFRKLVRRHRVAFAVGLLILLLIAGFTISTVMQAQTIRAQRDRANQEAATAQQVSDFMVDLFRNTNPAESGGTVTAENLLRTGAERLDRELSNQPEIRARLLDRLADAYSVRGPYAEARALYERSLRIRETAFGRDSLASAYSWGGLSTTSLNEGNYETAVTEGRRALAIREKFLPAGHEQIAASNDIIAAALSSGGHFAEAEGYGRKAVEIDRLHPERSARDRAGGMTTLGAILRQRGNYAEAISLLREAIRLRNTLPNGEAESGYALNELANALNLSGDSAGAEAAYRDCLAATRKVYGETHPNTAVVMANVAATLNVQGHYVEAERMAREGLVAFEKAVGSTHPRRAAFLETIGDAEEGQGHIAAAGAHFHELQAITSKAYGPKNLRSARGAIRLAQWEARYGQPRETLTLLAVARGALAPDTTEQALADRAEAEAQAKLGDTAAAVRLLTRSRDLLARKLGQRHWQTVRSADALSQLTPR